MPLVGTVVSPTELPKDQRDRMFELMAAHFDDVHRHTFERDLAEKQWAVILRDAQTGAIQGFSTLMLVEVEVEGQPIKAVFSGDTIVHRDYWGESELATVWGTFVLSLAESHRGTPFYWFLISKGFRTYKFLPLYFRDYWPRHDAPTPGFEDQLIQALAESKFPGRFDAGTGVIRFDGLKDRLRGDLAEVSEGRLKDPAVRFFLERNPSYAEGDELACIAALHPDNLQPVARRVLARLAARAATAE